MEYQDPEFIVAIRNKPPLTCCMTNHFQHRNIQVPQLTSKLGLLILLLLTAACSEPDRPSIALYPALQRGDIAQIERHIHWGSDLNQLTPDGNMPLHVAAKAGRLVVVELLLKHGAKIDLKNTKNHTPLYEATMSGRTQVVQRLIKMGAKINPNQLLEAVVTNQVADRDVIELLVQQGANINHTAENGDSLLHMAVKQGYRVVTKLLIANGADVNSKNETNHTPLWYATEHQYKAITTALKRNGAVLE